MLRRNGALPPAWRAEPQDAGQLLDALQFQVGVERVAPTVSVP
jgi:hypothetical protein